MASSWALQLAATAWCKDRIRFTEMDSVLAEEFAEILDGVRLNFESDAMRYRWLRDNKNAYPLFFIAQRDPNNVVVQFAGELADMNIDEMMKTTNTY